MRGNRGTKERVRVSPDERVTLAPDTPDAGLAAMLADLIRQNMARDPRKEADFSKLGSTVAITAPDAEVSIILAFKRGALVVADGGPESAGSTPEASGRDHQQPDIRITADAKTVLDLAMIRISGGVPMVLGADGRRVLKKLFTRDLRIIGLLRHPIQLVRLTRLISVNG